MKKYKTYIATLLVLALVYYFFFYEKEDVADGGGGLGPAEKSDDEVADKLSSAYADKSRSNVGQLPLSLEKRIGKIPLNTTPSGAGRWYGRNRKAALKAHYATGCDFVKGQNGTFGCF